MYQYQAIDQQLVNERVAQFKDQVERRLTGALPEDEFRPLRLQNGLYLQRHAYMLRIAIPYGLFNSQQMRMFAQIADQYDRGYGHFTTRQNIQFNWLKLEDTPQILLSFSYSSLFNCFTSFTYLTITPCTILSPQCNNTGLSVAFKKHACTSPL